MRAAILTGIREVEIQDIPMPEPKTGEVRLRVTAVGMCGSDVHYYADGKIGDQLINDNQIAGHELAAVVDKLGAGVTGIEVGTRVAVEPGINCGKCEQCALGNPNQCPNVIFFGTPPVQGAFTEYVCHPAELVFPAPPELTAEDIAMLEPLGIGMHAVRRVGIDYGDTVLVLGSGPVGLFIMQCARAAGATRILATDIRNYRHSFAKKYGAEFVANPEEQDIASWVMDITNGRGVDAAFECAGQTSTVKEAVNSSRIGGRVGLVGIPRVDEINIPIHTARRRELDIYNIRRSKFTIEAGMEMARVGSVDLRSMVTHRYSLDDIKSAFDVVDQYADGVVKAMVNISED